MKKISIPICALIFVMMFSMQTNAQLFRDITKVGTTAGQFLKINPGARALGMGGAFAAVSDDIYAGFYNPAGVALIEGGGEVTFNHAEWLADVSYDYASGSLNLGGMGTIFVTLTSLGTPEDIVRTFEFPEGDGRYWDATSLSIGLGYAKRLTDRFSIGFHAKYIQETIWNSTASGFALDVGTYYVTPFNDMVIGASVSNFGSKMQLDGRDIQFNYDPDDDDNSGPNNIPSIYEMDSYDIPLNFKVGLAMNVVETRNFVAKCAVDAVHPNDNEEYLNVGTELGFMDMVFGRVGYQKLLWDEDNGEAGLTFGAGVQYEMDNGLKIKFNYANADYGVLDRVHFLDLSLGF